MEFSEPHYRFELDGLSITGPKKDVLAVIRDLTHDEMKRCQVYYLKPMRVWRWTFHKAVKTDALVFLLESMTNGLRV